MDDPYNQPLDGPLPELVRFVLEQMRNLDLKGPDKLPREEYPRVWCTLSFAGNHLVDRIETLRLREHEQWETGDQASFELFGENRVSRAKVFTQRVVTDLARLGQSWHRLSVTASIDTQRFDPEQVPLRQELQVTVEDGRHDNSDTGDIEPPAHSAAETDHDASDTGPSHPPLQYDDPQRFREYVDSIPFEDDDDDDDLMSSMFEKPTPTEPQEELSSPQVVTKPRVVTEQTHIASTVKEYVASAGRIEENLLALVSLLWPMPKPSLGEYVFLS